MALVNCPECGREVSTSAEFCPNCGYILNKVAPTQKRTTSKNKNAWILPVMIVAAIALIVVIAVIAKSMSFKDPFKGCGRNMDREGIEKLYGKYEKVEDMDLSWCEMFNDVPCGNKKGSIWVNYDYSNSDEVTSIHWTYFLEDEDTDESVKTFLDKVDKYYTKKFGKEAEKLGDNAYGWIDKLGIGIGYQYDGDSINVIFGYE